MCGWGMLVHQTKVKAVAQRRRAEARVSGLQLGVVGLYSREAERKPLVSEGKLAVTGSSALKQSVRNSWRLKAENGCFGRKHFVL